MKISNYSFLFFSKKYENIKIDDVKNEFTNESTMNEINLIFNKFNKEKEITKKAIEIKV
jgi:hypothetical protein